MTLEAMKETLEAMKETLKEMQKAEKMAGALHDHLECHAEDHNAFVAQTLIEQALEMIEESVKYNKEMIRDAKAGSDFK